MLRLAKVVGANPQAHTVDLVFLDRADRVANVQVLAANCSTSTGSVGLPTPTPPTDQYGVQNTGARDVFAYVAFAGNIPVVLGFKMPELGQMTFQDGRQIHRHDSDVYTSLTQTGDWEMAFPNGLFLRIAASPTHEDLTGKDFDGQWKLANNTGAQLHVMLGLPGGAGSVHIDPQGNATLTLASLTVTAPTTTFNGNVQLNGALTATGDVKAGQISLQQHVHTQVSSGTALSGGPQG